MAAIIARLNSPVKEDGTRDVIYFETSIDAVIDHTTGKTVRDLINERTYPEATDTVAGLMGPQDKQNLDALYRQYIIVSRTDPERACQWYELLSSKYEVIASGPSIPSVPKEIHFFEKDSDTGAWVKTNLFDPYIQEACEILNRYDVVLRKRVDTVNGTTYISEFGSTYIPSVKYTANNTCSISYHATDDLTINGRPASTISMVLTNVDMSSISSEITKTVAIMVVSVGEDPMMDPTVTPNVPDPSDPTTGGSGTTQTPDPTT